MYEMYENDSPSPKKVFILNQCIRHQQNTISNYYILAKQFQFFDTVLNRNAWRVAISVGMYHVNDVMKTDQIARGYTNLRLGRISNEKSVLKVKKIHRPNQVDLRNEFLYLYIFFKFFNSPFQELIYAYNTNYTPILKVMVLVIQCKHGLNKMFSKYQTNISLQRNDYFYDVGLASRDVFILSKNNIN